MVKKRGEYFRVTYNRYYTISLGKTPFLMRDKRFSNEREPGKRTINMKKGSIIWAAATGGNKVHRVSTNFSYPLSLTAVSTFATALKAHTKCSRVSRSYTQMTAYTFTVVAGTNADRKAILYFRDALTGGVVSLSYPEPKDADVENTDEGERIKASVVDEIRLDLESATGRTYHSLYGIVIQRR